MRLWFYTALAFILTPVILPLFWISLLPYTIGKSFGQGMLMIADELD